MEIDFRTWAIMSTFENNLETPILTGNRGCEYRKNGICMVSQVAFGATLTD